MLIRLLKGGLLHLQNSFKSIFKPTRLIQNIFVILLRQTALKFKYFYRINPGVPVRLERQMPRAALNNLFEIFTALLYVDPNLVFTSCYLGLEDTPAKKLKERASQMIGLFDESCEMPSFRCGSPTNYLKGKCDRPLLERRLQ